MHVNLLIAYEGTNGPTAVVRVNDRNLLVTAAQVAIQTARNRMDWMARTDSVLGHVEAAEVQRLETALGLLIPELKEAHART